MLVGAARLGIIMGCDCWGAVVEADEESMVPALVLSSHLLRVANSW